MLKKRDSEDEFLNEIYADEIITLKDSDYDFHRLNQYGARMADKKIVDINLRPSLIIYCSNEQQLISVVKFANKYNYTIVVRSGGHSYTGISSSNLKNSIQVDVSKMNKISINGDLVTVQCGTKLRKLNNQLILHGLSIVRGECKNVAMGGHYLTSSLGLLSGSFGFGMDNVVSFKIITADGKINNINRNDDKNNYYKNIFGSSPGAFGIVTEYTIKGIKDEDYLNSRVVVRKYKFEKNKHIDIYTHIQNIMKKEEEKDKRDLFIQVLTGHSPNMLDLLPDLPIIGSLSNYFDFESDLNNYILVIMVWTGIDQGKMNDTIIKEYIDPLDKIESLHFPHKLNIELPLSLISSLAMTYNFKDYRHHTSLSHSDYWISDKYIKNIAQYIDDLTKMNNLIISCSHVFVSKSSQMYKNMGINSLVLRDSRVYFGQIISFKDEKISDELASFMRNFFDSNEKYWIHSDGNRRYNWMTPITIYPNATNLDDPNTLKHFFPNKDRLIELQNFKKKIDPKNIFYNKSMIKV